MDLDFSHPSVWDLRLAARQRIPHFAFEYLDSATGRETGVARNRAALDAVEFMPDILKGPIKAKFETTILGTTYASPFGIAPVGMSGLIWPGAEAILARAAAKHQIPYSQSTVATVTPEATGPSTQGMGWYQHYPVADPEIRRDMFRRIKDSGWTTLVVTVDVAGESRRERQRKAHVAMPPKLTPKILWAIAQRPSWALGTLREGLPRLAFPESYVSEAQRGNGFEHAGRIIRGYPDWSYIKDVREDWDGKLIVKGVMQPQDAARLINLGTDAIWVSNHSGRQIENAPSPLPQLPLIRAAVGPDVPLIYDSGGMGGLDILRAMAFGADFVALGKAFHYAVAAFGARGVDHLVHMLRDDMEANMAQMGIERPQDAHERLVSPPQNAQ